MTREPERQPLAQRQRKEGTKSFLTNDEPVFRQHGEGVSVAVFRDLEEGGRPSSEPVERAVTFQPHRMRAESEAIDHRPEAVAYARGYKVHLRALRMDRAGTLQP